MRKNFRFISMLIGLTGIILSVQSSVRAEDYYADDFEQKDDVKFWCCGPQAKGQVKNFRINSKGIVSAAEGGKVFSGKKAFKLDITLDKGAGRVANQESVYYNYWKGPNIKIPLNKPVYISGYIYPEQVPNDVEVSIGFGVQGTLRTLAKFTQGNAPIKVKLPAKDGWKFQQINLREFLIEEGPWNADTTLQFWYIHIVSSKPFHGQRIVLYVDDIKVSSEGQAMKLLSENPYRVNYKSAFSDRPQNPHNFIDNSSFELGQKNWFVADSKAFNWSIDNAEAFHGKKSLKIQRDKNSSSRIIIKSQVMPLKLKGKEDFTLSAYLKGDRSGSKIDINGWNFTLTDAWKRYVIPLKDYSSKYPYIEICHKGEGTFWLDAVQFEKGKLTPFKLPPSVEVGLSTSKKNNVYYPGEPVSVAVNVFNALGKDASSKVTWKITDFERKTIKKGSFDLSLKKDEGQSKIIKIDLPKGFFTFSADLESKENHIKKEAQTSIAVISPFSNKKQSGNNFFGGHFWNGTPDFVFAMAEEIGQKYSYIFHLLSWSGAPRNWKENNPQWKIADEKLAVVQKHNMIPVINLYGCPPWTGGKEEPQEPAKINDKLISGWSDYTTEIAKRYKDRVKYWVVWAEFMRAPFDVTAQNYLKFAKGAYEAIKKQDPDAVVVGYGIHEFKDTLLKAEAAFKAGTLDYVDVVGINPYWRPYSPEEMGYGKMLDELKGLMRKYNHGKEKPLWVTEIGWRGSDTLYSELPYGEGKTYTDFVTELSQAENIVRMHIISLAKGVKLFNTFCVYAGAYPSIFNYNLVHQGDFTPKLGYAAYNNMVNMLKGLKFDKEIRKGKGIRCYRFKDESNGEDVFTIWNCGKRAAKIALAVDPGKVEITNMVGKALLPEKSGKTILVLTGSPIYLRGKGKEFQKSIQKGKISYDKN